MKLEHLALNVSDPVALAAWYCDHLGWRIARGSKAPPYGHFLEAPGGGMMLEIYCNPPDAVPVYANMDPLLMHIAFVTDHPEADAERLVRAGATPVSDSTVEDGSRFIVLRDPWGIPLQLVRRAIPLLHPTPIS